MKLDILKREVAELNEILTGGFIAKIYQPLPREIVLKVRLATFGEKRLLLSADPGLGRIHTTSLRIPNPPAPPRFCAYLRAHLQGARIESIEAPINDRVALINCIRGRGESFEKRRLVLELLGRDSNIILVQSADGSIMECLHRIYAKQENLRSVYPGIVYQYPQKNPKTSPESGDETTNTQSYRIEANSVQAEEKTPTCKCAEEFSDSLDRNLDTYYATKLESQILGAYRRILQTPVRNRIKSLRTRLGKIEEDRNRLNLFATNQKCGELIKFNLKKITKGMNSIDLFDWETNSAKTIALDPALSAVGNMEAYFKKSSKARRGFAIVEERLIVTNEEIKALQDLEYLITEAKSVDELEQLADESSGVSIPETGKTKETTRKQQTGPARPFLEYVSPGGHKTLVGKSARGNEMILRRIADRNDLWFHARDFAGAHVFLICSGESSINDDDIQFAAALALRHSRGNSSGKGEVMVCYVKDVSRNKGAKPGQVRVKDFRSIMADCSRYALDETADRQIQ